MLVLAEKGLILFTVVPMVVGDLSSFARSAVLAGGWGVGPRRGQLTPTGQWDVHSIPCDAMTSTLTGAVDMCGGFCCSGLAASGERLCHVPLVLVVHSLPPSSPRVLHLSHCFPFHCVIVAVVIVLF